MNSTILHSLTVSLAKRSYPIHIGQGLLTDADCFGLQAGQRVMIVTNQTVAPLYLQPLTESLQAAQIQTDHLILPDGEAFKTLATWQQIFTALLEQNHTRRSTIIALGGGVIGDMAGFAAACYQRGIAFIQVPTTLLSQVDSSVGGKTAVNHPLGKNMIGAFYQPQAVVIDLNCLQTLPTREFSAGLAEVIKYGVIGDAQFFSWLETNMDRLMAQAPVALSECIYHCCQRKAAVVADDEHEQGRRAILNLGHTFGHAIEAELGYGNWLHGEAVAVGMLMAAKTAELLKLADSQLFIRLKQLLQRANLPVRRPNNMPVATYLPHMLRDKKVLTGDIRLILPTAIGHCCIVDQVDPQIIQQAIQQIAAD